MNDVIAIIPARSGSKTLAHKNIKLLSGHPLIAYSIAAAQLSKSIGRIIVSTDSEHYADIARKYGAEVPFMRPAKLSGDKSGDKEFLAHAMEWMAEYEAYRPEYWVHLRPTTPLREPQIIDEAIELFLRAQSSTSLRSAHPTPESPMKWFVKVGSNFEGIVDTDVSNLPKEAFKQVYVPNGYVDILKRSVVMGANTIHGESMLSFVSPVVNEVDSIEEFQYIDYQLKTLGSKLSDHLDRVVK